MGALYGIILTLSCLTPHLTKWLYRLYLSIGRRLNANPSHYRRRKGARLNKPHTPAFNPLEPGRRSRRKPEQVPRKIIALRIQNPKASPRILAQMFNRDDALTSGQTVSHEYVRYTLKAHAFQIKILSRQRHNRRPWPVPHHQTWAVDLTYMSDAKGNPQPILGIIEHASRACLCLKAVRNKTSATVLRTLADIIELTQQKPKFLRTDNERNFTGKVFRFGLRLINIKHQTTDIAAPWQNGKAERFFGIFKQKAKGLVFSTLDELNHHLATFQFWYYHIQPHGYLDYQMPFEAYHKHGIQYRQPGQAEPPLFDAWDGRLTGFWFRRE